jgi:inner membrane protein
MAEQPSMSARLPTRSMGLKLLLVCALALLMAIPALMVFGLLGDRTNRADKVAREIGETVGGPQTFLGPVLAVPYSIPAEKAGEAPTRDSLFIFPASADAQVQTKAEIRRRSLFKVPVWTADLKLTSRFDLAESAARAPRGAKMEWDRAELLVAATDARGAQADILVQTGGKSLNLAPALTLSDLSTRDGESGKLQFFGTPAAGLTPDARFDAVANARFSGAQRLALLAWGKTTKVRVTGDSPNPSFDGGFLPTTRDVASKGFTADWSVPFIARGVPAEGDSAALARLGAASVGVSFVDPANPYQAVSRSLKYAPMFLGLVFLAYFVFETTQAKRVHAAQYVLIGLAQLTFYLLLLSIAERTGFDIAFGIAATATVALISAYAGWVFESRRQGLIALAAFTALYGLIYVLMRLEDFALLVGAVTSFAAIAAVMYFTRRIDWYGAAAIPAAPKTA